MRIPQCLPKVTAQQKFDQEQQTKTDGAKEKA